MLTKQTLRFDLFHTNPVEAKLITEIKTLKKMKQWTQYVRDGLRLIIDLHAGNTIVLYEMFPHLQTPPPPSSQHILDEMARMLEQLADEITLPSTQQIKTIQVEKFTEPVFDKEDDDMILSVIVDAGAGKRASQNFLKSMMALN